MIGILIEMQYLIRERVRKWWDFVLHEASGTEQVADVAPCGFFC